MAFLKKNGEKQEIKQSASVTLYGVVVPTSLFDFRSVKV